MKNARKTVDRRTEKRRKLDYEYNDKILALLSEKIVGVTENLELREKIMEAFKARLDKGKKEYGHGLNIHDGRKWIAESTEEMLDASVYNAAQLLLMEEIWKDVS